MINPNRATSEEVLRRLEKASYERMRIELKCTVEMLMRDFEMTWGDIGALLEITPEAAKYRVIDGGMTLKELNALAHIFSTEPYIIFRPREPWIKT